MGTDGSADVTVSDRFLTPDGCAGRVPLVASVAAVGFALTSIGGLAGCATVDPATRQFAETQALCTACHGDDGRSRSTRAPILAGLQPDYLVAQLHAFRDRSRADDGARTFMWPMTAGLSDPTIERLAARFAALPPVSGERTSTGDTTAGRDLYDKGAAERGIPPCGSCHGDAAQGLAAFPRLAGQHEDYLAAQLAAYADNSRANPIMGPIAMKLSRQEIAQVAADLAARGTSPGAPMAAR